MKIVEIFKSLQGEGSTQGVNSLFIRLPYCNLSCTNCDSVYSWRKDKLKIIEYDDDEYVFDIIRKRTQYINNIVFTGGEPLLAKNVKSILKIMNKFPTKNYEIETNGTLVLDSAKWKPLPVSTKIQFNISPKENFPQINNPVTIEPILINQLKKWKHPRILFIVKYLFKDSKDIKFVVEQQNKYLLPSSQIWLQPISTTKEQVLKLTKKYFKQIISHGWNISMRNHVLLFDNEKGV